MWWGLGQRMASEEKEEQVPAQITSVDGGCL